MVFVATATMVIAAPLLVGDGEQQWWAGRQVVVGERSIAVIGSVETRAESLVIARVRRTGDRLELTQTACAVRFAEVAGVETKMRDATVARLPPARMTLRPGPAGSWQVTDAVSGWGREDVDRDGHPGATVVIDSALCGGELYVGSRTTTRIDGHATDDGLVAAVWVRVQQTIFGASGWCLSKAASDTDEVQRGTVAYVRVESGVTCEALAKSDWPVPEAPEREP